ncbi:MAG TPA: 30S ribosomal protein S2 [Candidatus Hydrogenedentes bacterium]|nr:30S ribosomal protein S2 [Candidatus Hydrogenedentota bacterium]
MPVVTIRELLEAGIHFGHQTRRWNPKMRRFIFGQRNGIYIIDLKQTLRQINKAYATVREAVAAGGTVLFVGTKKQAQESVEREAKRCGMFYVNSRWLGGTLTNWQTVRNSIQRLLDLEEMEASGQIEQYSKKEATRIRKQRAQLDKSLSGIKQMPGPPDVLFIIDVKREEIAMREARRLGITSIAVADTNADPDEIDIPIPGNDDALRAVALFCRVMSDAVMEGRMLADKVMEETQARASRNAPSQRAAEPVAVEAAETVTMAEAKE